ncbi:MAG: hypothetical protein AAGC64_02310 [Bacteroidota bacterium]
MRISLVFVWVFLSSVVFAQNKLSDRIYFGGGGGFSASSSQTNISVFPQVGYKITEPYSIGVGLIYQYVKYDNPIDQSVSNYGWSVFNRFNILEQFFIYAEFERLTFEFFTDTSFERTDREGYNSLLLGGGFSNRIGGNAAFNTTVLYNVLYSSDETSPYNSPWVIRAGVGLGMF